MQESPRPSATICVLLYGEHPDLADRCLGGILRGVPPEELNLRI